jgi:hypothetical protein
MEDMRKMVQYLQEQLNKQSQTSFEWETRYKMLEQQSSGTDLRRGAELAISYSMYDYLHKYQEYVQPFMRVRPPFTDVKLLNDPKTDPLKVTLMSSIFSIGATIFGNASHAQEFRHKARQSLMVMFDVTHPVIAGINHLLSKSYLAAGEFEKSQYYNSVAQTMSEVILQRMNTTEYEGIDLDHVYSVSMLSTAKFTLDLDAQLRIMNELWERTFKKFESGELEQDRVSFLGGILVGRLWVEVTIELMKMRIEFDKKHPNLPRGTVPTVRPMYPGEMGMEYRAVVPTPSQLLPEASMQRYLGMLQQAAIYHSQSKMAAASHIGAMLQITKAWIYLFGGFYDLAEKLADEAFMTSQSKESFAPFSMGTSCILGQIYIYLKKMSKFDVVAANLKSQAEFSGLAQMMYEKLQDLATEQKKLWESGFEFEPSVFVNNVARIVFSPVGLPGRRMTFEGQHYSLSGTAAINKMISSMATERTPVVMDEDNRVMAALSMTTDPFVLEAGMFAHDSPPQSHESLEEKEDGLPSVLYAMNSNYRSAAGSPNQSSPSSISSSASSPKPLFGVTSPLSGDVNNKMPIQNLVSNTNQSFITSPLTPPQAQLPQMSPFVQVVQPEETVSDTNVLDFFNTNSSGNSYDDTSLPLTPNSPWFRQ